MCETITPSGQVIEVPRLSTSARIIQLLEEILAKLPPTKADEEKAVLDSYWSAKTPAAERAAMAELIRLGLVAVPL